MAAVVTSAVGTFVKLVEDGKVGTVTVAFERAITRSFAKHPMRHTTVAEIKRRFEMCAAIFVKLRGELHWGLQRALDKIPEYLDAELSGSAWTPDARACWMPGDDT